MNEKKQTYKSFVGVDIGKFFFDVAIIGNLKCFRYPNTKAGFVKCFKDHKLSLPQALVVVEATGGHEKAWMMFLLSKNIAVHQANPRKVKLFIRSFGTEAKTDMLDAKALAQYALERHETLNLYVSKEITIETLSKLIKRRSELVAIRTQERNRIQSPDRSLIERSAKMMLKVLDKAIAQIEHQLTELQNHESLQEKSLTLKNISGVGDTVALTLLAAMPELGTISNKQAASLAGVAPHPKQSGQHQGYRRTCGGRQNIKPILFLAAMTASRSKSSLGDFYRNLLANGKKPIVAIVAVMRKIIVIANAKLRDLRLLKESLTT
ncbi:MAG: IS110 family transposase [Proteobacteria bacterium]|nr:IS110 family transposase [Pseudomonadota bacterium]